MGAWGVPGRGAVLVERLLGSAKHFTLRSVLQRTSETLTLLESSALFWYFLHNEKPFPEKVSLFLPISGEKCLFLGSYWGCLPF